MRTDDLHSLPERLPVPPDDGGCAHRPGALLPIRSPRLIVVVMAALFAIFHIFMVSIPVLSSGGSGESQAFAAALFDLPLFWALGMFPGGRSVLYGFSPWVYIFVFAVGGTLMYAAVGALVGWGMHIVRQALRAG